MRTLLAAVATVLLCCGCGSLESSMGTRRDNGTVRSVTHGKVRLDGVTVVQAAGATVPALSVTIGSTSPTFREVDQGGASAEARADGNTVAPIK